jgi:hypothetical protein
MKRQRETPDESAPERKTALRIHKSAVLQLPLDIWRILRSYLLVSELSKFVRANSSFKIERGLIMTLRSQITPSMYTQPQKKQLFRWTAMNLLLDGVLSQAQVEGLCPTLAKLIFLDGTFYEELIMGLVSLDQVKRIANRNITILHLIFVNGCGYDEWRRNLVTLEHLQDMWHASPNGFFNSYPEPPFSRGREITRSEKKIRARASYVSST